MSAPPLDPEPTVVTLDYADFAPLLDDLARLGIRANIRFVLHGDGLKWSLSGGTWTSGHGSVTP